MPFYDIHHCISLTDAQKDALAEKITYLHSGKFTTPSLFINVAFTDVGQRQIYVAGGARTAAQFEQLCEELSEVWNEVVDVGGPKETHSQRSLRGVFVLGGLAAGLEVGFRVPMPGEDHVYLKSNLQAWKQLADSGDEDFAGLIKELETRKEFIAQL
ncbi:hypothetical protein NA57DRAFT_80897 [Rhizodiscina lignyota]|uniref:Tautomerase cis-CaaD-like domain-containing protein n=1 Tax=Rhizodiscina lignyota TaxID=1504668 RepID=A0A9P4M1W0_9PEZI|nr:hypothetical protein NA57DRAFT_80897 [Rhizodiscina lignyota]